MRTFARWLLAAAMVFAGIGHLTWARREFRAQVPEWTTRIAPLDEDGVVLASGVVEVALGVSLVACRRRRRLAGAVLAAFFVAVLPGNWAQFTHRRDGFGLDTDVKRLVRLFLQPVLVAWAVWSTRR
ncbi:hypothetical protein [Microbacterium sp. SORGH_AS_0888]|uniref:DoxX family protein n=1 Tax=Microbacterium sp. SORGH_AS_0888 TaxID=3041791 RepID=UPI00278180DD|nr:hypothetical protein [Microbacterium sp. SORGH_AS_0888]MDQ1129179.1 putative membrane protein [Microbacterium sp. SORGH_AS_0888]